MTAGIIDPDEIASHAVEAAAKETDAWDEAWNAAWMAAWRAYDADGKEHDRRIDIYTASIEAAREAFAHWVRK